MPMTGRNDPCPCGSGKKYKKCCGQVGPIVLGARVVPSQERQCGDCTACCDGWLRATINEHEMKPGTPCHFVREGSCSIYDQRPLTPCRQFVCGWMRPGNPFPESFRPMESGVIIYPTTWRSRPAYRLVSAGRDPGHAMLKWMMRFCRQTDTPFSYDKAGETVAYSPNGATLSPGGAVMVRARHSVRDRRVRHAGVLNRNPSDCRGSHLGGSHAFR